MVDLKLFLIRTLDECNLHSPLFYRLPIKYKIRESFSVKLIHLNFIVPNTILLGIYVMQ